MTRRARVIVDAVTGCQSVLVESEYECEGLRGEVWKPDEC